MRKVSRAVAADERGQRARPSVQERQGRQGRQCCLGVGITLRSKGQTVLQIYTAQVPAQWPYREIVGRMISAVCRHVESTERCTGLEWRVVSAFNEAFNNVVQHAYGRSGKGKVTVEMRVDSARLVLEIMDQGHGFEFDAHVCAIAPRLDALDHGGMGLFIMRRSVSRVTYRRGKTNRLILVQELSDCRSDDRAAAGSRNRGTPC
jgi:anti-sigma regulatory factor (Ser/Thr protein kinase)